MLTQNTIKARLAFAGRASLYDNDKISTSIPIGTEADGYWEVLLDIKIVD